MTGWELFDESGKAGSQPIQAFLGPPRGFPAATAAAITSALVRSTRGRRPSVSADRAQHQLFELLRAHDHRAAAFLMVYHASRSR